MVGVVASRLVLQSFSPLPADNGNSLRLPLAVPFAKRAPHIALLAPPIQYVSAAFPANILQRTKQLVPVEAALVAHSARRGLRRPHELDAVLLRAHHLDGVFVVEEKVDQLEAPSGPSNLLGRGIGLLRIERIPGAVHIGGRGVAREQNAPGGVLPETFDRL